MWLLPHLPQVSAAAIHAYYRASRAGGSVPSAGSVLVVGNHPNSLIDPAFLAWAARRPVRFLAKAPLFSDKLVGWLIRGSGSIPVYRKQDDATQMSRNDETFRAVYDALGIGSAVALFPEGISHSASELAPLKTGAARIALGAVEQAGGAFPIIPVGIVLRAKDRFRSDAHVIVGDAIQWDDLAVRGPGDRDAVHELTARIDRALRQVTLNLARWEDEAVVRTAESVWAAAQGADAEPSAQVARVTTAAETLAKLRASNDERWAVLARDVREHARVLKLLGLRPADVVVDSRVGTAARWTIQRLTLVGALQAVLAAVAIVLFWIPYRLTGVIAGTMTKDSDTRATYRLMTGVPMFLVWFFALAVATGISMGWLFGVGAFVAMPLLALAGLHSVEHWRSTLRTARSWFVIRTGDPRISALRERQADLARRLDAAFAHAQTS